MSELEAQHIVYATIEYDDGTRDGGNDFDVYDKSEADKVIADLEESHKMEVEQLLMKIVELKNKALQYKVLNEEHCRDLNTQERFFAEQIAHHKHKRCLAMAKWCDEVMMSCELRGYTVHRIWYNRHQWAMRWKYKWLEIAEKFKLNSTAQ